MLYVQEVVCWGSFHKDSLKYFCSGHVSDSSVAEIQMDAFLTNIRKLISDTCYIILIYMSVIIIKELLATVIWLYLKRSGSEHGGSMII